MTNEKFSVAALVWEARVIATLAIITTFFGFGWARSSDDTGDHQRDEAATAPRRSGRQAPVLPATNPPPIKLSAAKLLRAPLSFEPNLGQADPTIQFLSHGSGFTLFLAPAELTLGLERRQPARPTTERPSADTLRMSLIGANRTANAVGLARQSGVVSYFMGNDPKTWHSGIPTYGRVDYPQVYPGVDLVFYGNQRRLEYDFVVSPGADPGRIAWRIAGARAGIDRNGNLILDAPHGAVTFEKPVIYQMESGKKVPIQGTFAVAANQVRFRLGRYDHSRALTIDPVLSYVTYLAGTGSDQISQTTGPGILQNSSSQGIAFDAAGSAYVTGRTTSADLPTRNGYQMGQNKGGAPSAFVAKFSPDGSSLVYSTYLGGTGWDYAYAIAVDSSGSAYVTGLTNSNDFPITSGAYQIVCSPLPNNKSASASAAAATCNSSNSSAFVTKLNPNGNALVYSTFLGGYGWSYGTGIAVDSAGHAYVAGNESAPCNTSYLFQACFPTTAGATIGASAVSTNPQWAFAAVFDPAGANLLYSTLFGDLNGLKTSTTTTAGIAWATGMAVDSGGYFYLIGNTTAGKLPTTQDAVQPSGVPLDYSGSNVTAYRGFIARFNPVTPAASLAACTYLGGKTGNTSDYLSGIAIDGSSNIYVAGYTNSTDFPVTSGAYGTACGPGGGTCAAGHVTKLNPSLTSILWSTYVGGSRHDGGDNLYFTGPVQLDGKGNVYVTGQANPNFPLLNSVEPAICCGGGQVVVELDPTGSNLLFSTSIGSGGKDSMQTAGLAVDSAGTIYVAGNNLGADLITTTGAFQTTNPAPSCCYHGFVAKITPTTAPQITMTGSTAAVVNAASSQTGGIAPNEFISIYGTGLGPAAGVSSSTPTTSLGGTSVLIGGLQAYLIYSQAGLVSGLVPFGVSGLQNTTIQVQYNSQSGNTITVPLATSSPGIFTQSFGPGQAWVVNQDNTFNSSSNPAARNSYIAFWVTGQGLVNTSLEDGAQPASPYPTPMLPVSVSVGGVPVPAANIWDGLIYTGEIQINVQIPANAPTGSAIPLVVTIGGVSSRSDATIAVN